MKLQGAGSTGQQLRWSALALIVTAQFMVILDVAIVNVALPSIKSDLGFSQASLQWVVSAYAIFFGGALLLGGRLGDLLGRRRLFVAGLAVFAASSLLCGLAWSEASLITFRALQGLGGAMLAPAALALLMTTFAEGRDRNVALGIYGAAAGSGAAVGVLLGGVLTSYLSWPWIFFVNVPVALAAIALTPVLLRESRADNALRHFDVAGAASITAGLMLLVYALTRATTDGWATATTIGLLAASAVLVALVHRDRAALQGAAPAAADLPDSLARRRQRGDADHRLGHVLGVLPADALPAGRPPLLGDPDRRRVQRLRDLRRRRIEPRAGRRQPLRRPRHAHGRHPRLGALGRVADATADRRPLLLGLFPAFVLGGAGLGFSFVPLTIASLTGVERADAGIASGLVNTSRQIGGAIGLAAVSAIAATSTAQLRRCTPRGRAASAAALDHGFQTALYVLTGLLIVGAVIAGVWIKPQRAAQAQAPQAELDVLKEAA